MAQTAQTALMERKALPGLTALQAQRVRMVRTALMAARF
jgi:hypothetical protein